MSRAISKEALEELRAVPLFEGCSDKELTEIKKLADEVDIKAGEVIVRQGAFGTDAFVLLNGSVTVSVHGSEVATLQTGAHFGELAPLDHMPRSATVTALSDSRVLVFGGREFSSLLGAHPAVSRKMMADLAHRAREAAQKD
jgi:CRP/FNR family transcriptional regulator, cyclic AMP receptor protein